MATFIGKYDAKADTKGRIFIPSAYRRLLPTDEKDQIVMLMDVESQCLILYPEAVWLKKAEELKANLNLWKHEDKLLMMCFVENSVYLEIDSQGRVLIPKKTLQIMGVENQEVLFIGMIDRFALWSKSKYEQVRLSSANFAARIDEKMVQSQSLTKG